MDKDKLTFLAFFLEQKAFFTFLILSLKKRIKMIHRDHQKKQHNNVWFGFTLGSIIGATGLFLIGTTQGRKLLKKAMEMAENLEMSAQDMIVDLEKAGEKTEQKIKDIVEPLIEHTLLHTVLQKIQTVLPSHGTSEKSAHKSTRTPPV